MSENLQFLTRKESFELFGKFEVTPEDILSNGTYNEQYMLRTFSKVDSIGQILLYKCAISIAVIGAGGKNYGKIRHENTIHDIVDIFNKYNVLYNMNQNEKYNDEQLTARRLVRLFRHQIVNYITKTNKSSYLWNKYSDHDLKYIGICFPGAEHVLESKDEALYLAKVYKKLDERLNTKFVDRLKRVLTTRGIIIDYALI